ncbi:Ribonuclease H-like superfamily [Sesbania bispinosa]|nr:Ribonuclease H-like superfamily [Sesbania bispinosa]
MVEEIGEDNAVQVVTDGASNLMAKGELLEYKRTKLFWAPWAAHCLDLILEDIGELSVFNTTITNAKKIQLTFMGILGFLICIESIPREGN